MKINFTITADFEAEITEDIAYEVMKDYGGNFNAWMEDNYSDYTCESEFEVEDINYDKKEATKILSIIRKYIDEKGDTFLKSNLRSRLRNSKFPTAHIPALENMQKLEIDLELMEKIFEFADFNNPKMEFNFIHLNGEYAEATNTRMTIRHKHKFNFENPIYFPPFFIEPMKDDAEVYIFENNKLFMKYKDEWFYGIDDYYVSRPFPDFSRILSKDDFFETCPFIANYKDIKVINSDEKTAQIPILEANYYIDKMYFNLINKFDIDVVGCYSNSEILPLFFKGKDFEIVVMTKNIEPKNALPNTTN